MRPPPLHFTHCKPKLVGADFTALDFELGSGGYLEGCRSPLGVLGAYWFFEEGGHSALQERVAAVAVGGRGGGGGESRVDGRFVVVDGGGIAHAFDVCVIAVDVHLFAACLLLLGCCCCCC